MMRRRTLALVVSVLAIGLAFGSSRLGRGAGTVPVRLSDQEFWTLASDSSEPDGAFHSENLVSNEARFQAVIPELVRTVTPGRVYLGVGPEQNFSYIAASRPAMAFIVDIRRGNLDLHLIYKALFELSADRVEFVSRLFSRKRPPGLTATSSVNDIFDAFAKAPPAQALYDHNLKAIENQLAAKHGFPLSSVDRQGIEFVYSSVFQSGPELRYELNNGAGGFGRGTGFPTYADLMTATDDTGRNRSYLATEDSFRFLKDLEARNLIVPVVGNFGGPKALRAVAAYLKKIGATVSAFYVSNVEQYLRQDGIWGNFCTNVAALPLDRTSTFIRSVRNGWSGRGTRIIGFPIELDPILPEVAACTSRR
jgi:hypothetical protein